MLFRQPSGSDEGADDDHATGQPKAAQGANDPIASGLPRMASAAGHSFRNMPTIIGFAITRAQSLYCAALAAGISNLRRLAERVVDIIGRAGSVAHVS
jgi:hypothetical protein